jgi:AcrR family transcriptional regulator
MDVRDPMAADAPNHLSPRAHEIVDAALEILEEEGADGLSMRRVAERVGIRAPSIYKHLADKQALEAAIISVGFERLADAGEAALLDADEPVAVLARVYRQFATGHPHLYRLMTERELRRDLLTPGVEARASLLVVEAMGQNADLARAAWAFAHGMTILELNNRFPPGADLDAAWDQGIQAFTPKR